MADQDETGAAPRRAGLTIPGTPSEPPRRSGLDLSGIASQPKPRPDTDEIARVATASGFTSRHGSDSQAAVEEMPPPRRRLKRSPATAQFNGRCRPDVLRRIYAYCEAARLTNGEFLEAAIAALEKERASPSA